MPWRLFFPLARGVRGLAAGGRTRHVAGEVEAEGVAAERIGDGERRRESGSLRSSKGAQVRENSRAAFGERPATAHPDRTA